MINSLLFGAAAFVTGFYIADQREIDKALVQFDALVHNRSEILKHILQNQLPGFTRCLSGNGLIGGHGNL